MAVQDILGIKATFKGLEVNPSISKKWDGFKYTRKFRQAFYVFDVQRGKSNTITVDGKTIEGNLIPDFQDNLTHYVNVTIV